MVNLNKLGSLTSKMSIITLGCIALNLCIFNVQGSWDALMTVSTSCVNVYINDYCVLSSIDHLSVNPPEGSQRA